MDQIKIGRFIAAMRREAGLAQRELAKALGLSNCTFSTWECGDGLPEIANNLLPGGLPGVTADGQLRGKRA